MYCRRETVQQVTAVTAASAAPAVPLEADVGGSIPERGGGPGQPRPGRRLQTRPRHLRQGRDAGLLPHHVEQLGRGARQEDGRRGGTAEKYI